MNKPTFTKTNNEYIEVRESEIHGRGVFAKKDIPKGTHIIEYIGEKVTNEEAEKREEENNKKGLTYIFILNDKYCLDGAVGGNESICINHGCEPNCDIDIIDDRIWIFPLRDIKKGEELSYDYAFPHDDLFRIKCFCKSENCRGVLQDNPPIEEEEE